VQIDELAPHVCPARRFDHTSAVVDLRKTRITVGLQGAGELAHVLLGMLAFAIGRVRKPHGRRALARCGPLVAHVRPQPTSFGFAAPGR
jgi:hypothetical protein